MVFHLTNSQRRVARKHTPWIISPVDRGDLLDQADSATKDSYDAKSESQNLQSLSRDSNQQRREDGLPVFKRHPKAGAIELFYDLFFVANLTTFTTNHEVSDADTLKSYIGFFTLMWFTWLSTSLYDVRFSFDSVYDRICKAAAFGVMTGFAVVSPQYKPPQIDDADPALDTSFAFKAMALILMASRLALMIQYGVVLIFVRDYRKTRLPLILTMIAHFLAAMIYLGTYFGFPEDGMGTNNTVYAAWYTVVAIEAFAVILIPVYWEEINFKHSNLIERVGLLTLIIIGEGVIGMTKSVSTILQNAISVSGQSIGTVVAALILIYFVWMLYFDQIDDDRFGVLRQPLWAIFHYPLHVAILLTLEGSTQFIVWNELVQTIDYLYAIFPPATPEQTGAEYAAALRGNLTIFNEIFRSKNITDAYNYTGNLDAIAKLDLQTKTGLQELVGILNMLTWSLYKFVFGVFALTPPENTTGQIRSTKEQVALLLGKFITVFLYFIISAGVFLMILGAMYFVGTKHKSRMEYGAVTLRLLAGLALSLVTLTAVHLGSGTALRLWISPWMIPMVVLVYFFVIAVDNVLMTIWADEELGAQTVHQVEEGSD